MSNRTTTGQDTVTRAPICRDGDSTHDAAMNDALNNTRYAYSGEMPAPLAVCQQSPDAPDPDSTTAYLALAAEETRAAIGHLELACADSRVDASVRRVALDALRDALTAIEAEMEAHA